MRITILKWCNFKKKIIKNTTIMEHTKQLEELNKDTLAKLEAYIKTKADASEEDHEKIGVAKDKWQAAWNEFLQTLIVLEKLEI
jgi:hypothetical protein